MCDCGIRGDRRLARRRHSALSAACWCSKSRATEAVEQCFYRNTPAVFQTLCEGFPRPAACSRAAWSPWCRSDPAGRSEDREGRSPCHRRPRDAMRQPLCRTCDMTMHGRRAVDPIGTSGSARCAARDLRHVDAQIDACVFVRLSSRFTDTRASRRVQVSRECDVSMRMSKSYRSRACSCSSRKISCALSHPRIVFSSRASALSDVDARVDVDARYRTPSTRAVHRGVHLCGCKPA